MENDEKLTEENDEEIIEEEEQADEPIIKLKLIAPSNVVRKKTLKEVVSKDFEEDDEPIFNLEEDLSADFVFQEQENPEYEEPIREDEKSQMSGFYSENKDDHYSENKNDEESKYSTPSSLKEASFERNKKRDIFEINPFSNSIDSHRKYEFS